MDEAGVIQRLWMLWPTAEHAELLCEALAYSEEAMRMHPGSATLLCMRGDLLQLAPPSYHSDDNAEGCYLRAIQVEPRYAEGWESLGWYYYAVTDEYAPAAGAFRRAIECGAGSDSVRELAAALAAQGQCGEARRLIQKALSREADQGRRAALLDLQRDMDQGEYEDPA